MKAADIGVAVIAKNEADRILKLLKSVSFAEDIVVVDSGSDDGTQSLCTQMGARVIRRDWEGFASQKQFAMEQVRSEWILNLDADEEIPELLWREMVDAVENAPPDVHGFSMPRLSRYLNRWIRHGGWYPDRKVRLVRKESGQWVGDRLHEH
ncbi:MAG: glycosyltransferase family 2 protein, partial [Thermodesulfobacteriota bacterium]